ncbi:BirA family biotin operon repressor/biotin-[acetyl-CoA-carboxylase] ligase [Arthrobacter sp. CAN_A212]|uniref:biotin--[acetyl-CoA-carboxylase] ligase n=1 Tax=unclassified Arthrobacter TaxID=235627 RepID=UPI0018CB42AD|nr:biotin--[acetyl-CoA-carboxylase] ligase [Arthrobacter sp. CAN_C5]MBP2217704.1 BirA family biotin operon repressor/biotin-[acetyl-CoA-carboxylase] ligase [Arthrobacter sp. CAN_C5]
MTSRYSNLERPGLDEAALRDALCAPKGPYGRLDVVAETGSTNTDLVRHAQLRADEWPDLSVLTAEQQSAGRGRLDREWIAPERSSLIVSILLRPHNPQGRPLPTQSYSWLSLLAALALAESIEERTEISPQLKWPNDVLVDGRKLAGVLAQLVADDRGGPAAVVVGVGANVSLTDQELPVPSATSLLLEYSTTTDRNVLLRAFLRRLADHYAAFQAVDGDARREWADGTTLAQRVSDRMVTLGEHVRVELPGGMELMGRALGLDAHGALLIRDYDDERHTVTAGDVVHVRQVP